MGKFERFKESNWKQRYWIPVSTGMTGKMKGVKMIRVLFKLVVLSVFIFISCLNAQNVKPDSTAKKTVAVMPFSNIMKDSSIEWLSDGIAETMTTKISQVSSFTVVERTRLDEAMKEIALGLLRLIQAKS